ncbi:DNA-binding transcriptional regulator, LysR family [Paraburkholderia unamae]|uniref:LysR family transcriptional regulator n=1 Tax=Paraburkholderia unamae TaxID=219649 RepID=UPI001CAF249C|nr:LysR family transcriptional regulator [Paraburkholderia unamae]CAG9267620.1 DNA-binding transcriptional regulator, LysR family [Paraburkholderia unamae]
MDRLDAMTVLIAVVDAGSLSAAARRLGMPLATVSRKIGELEGHLKTRLLTRTTRQLSLTEAGRSYVAACRRILEDVGEAERAATGEYSEPKGELAITAPVVFGRLHVLPVVAEFLARYPEIGVRIMLADSIVNLLEEHVDLAARIGELPDSALVAMRVGAIRRVVCASPDYLAAHGVPAHPRDLAAHACITSDGLTSARSWAFWLGREAVSLPVRSRLVLNTAEAAIDAAMLGVGLTRVLSYQVASAAREGKLQVVLEAFEPPPWPVSLVHAGQAPLPLKLRAFLDFAAPRLRARLEGARLASASSV